MENLKLGRWQGPCLQILDLLLHIERLTPLYTCWILENTEARSIAPWESDGCWVCFVHAGKIHFDVATLAFPSSYHSAVAGCFSPDLGIQ